MALSHLLYKLKNTKPNRRSKKSFLALEKRYPEGEDSWGLNIPFVHKVFVKIWPFYKHYFRVRVFGEENVPQNGAFMATANHTGQIAIDGALISVAFFADIKHPRVLRPMAERFLYKTPFLGAWASAMGAVLGDRRNCQTLLKAGEAVLVFPEGVKGIAKSSSEYYQMQPFPTGFYRMALEAHCPILPIAVVGAEEFYPFVYQARTLAKKLGLPSLPITPNLLPLPSPVDIYIGPLHHPPKTLTEDSSDKEIKIQVDRIQRDIDKMVQEGLKKRRPFLLAKKGRFHKGGKDVL